MQAVIGFDDDVGGWWRTDYYGYVLNRRRYSGPSRGFLIAQFRIIGLLHSATYSWLTCRTGAVESGRSAVSYLRA